ncbi:MAG: DUF899 family protein [Caulobacteraceae bacterium]
MDAKTETLVPALELARENPIRQVGESAPYREARTALLAEEIELRRRIEKVAAQRRALPPGPEAKSAWRFVSASGETDLSGLFGDHETLILHSYMFGPERQRPCPMCTNMLDGWDANAADVAQRASLAAVSRSSIEWLMAWKAERGWRHLTLVSDADGEFSRDVGALLPDGSESGVQTVFTRRDGKIRLFWASEMWISTADPGQDPRGAPDPAPLWNILDLTPEGRAPDWYPKLTY